MYEIDFDKFKDIFFSEAKEHLDSADAALGILRNNPKDTGALYELFRAAHTLKSMSATMGFDNVTPLVTELSRTLDMLHKGKAISTAETTALVADCFVCVKALIGDAASSGGNSAPAETFIAKLKAVAEPLHNDQEITAVKELFFSKVAGYMESVRGLLPRLSAAPEDRQLLDEAFQIIHAIHDLAAAMGYVKITELSTPMAALLGRMKESKMPSSPESVQLLATCFDSIRLLVDEAAAGEDRHISIAQLRETLQALLNR